MLIFKIYLAPKIANNYEEKHSSKFDRLTSDELLSNERQVVSFSNRQLSLRDVSIRGGVSQVVGSSGGEMGGGRVETAGGISELSSTGG